ncbi:hypothetical protein GWK47_017007 [Chionoecetes opilio]|uniref:Ig-like domain-containing protein n=1 Tax=Chionoecetes opilio TaxID=41210 RepID=A0A8J5CHF7_CHIOP|nr:hypothetical protein GWK47_017007 [Chionoecetes opilio]
MLCVASVLISVALAFEPVVGEDSLSRDSGLGSIIEEEFHEGLDEVASVWAPRCRRTVRHHHAARVALPTPVVFTVDTTLPNYGRVCLEEREGEEGSGAEQQPRFLHDQLTLNVSVQLGSTAHLHCRLAGITDQSVSWYRKTGDEIHLITFDFQTYHNDDRFALNFEQPNDWRLRIRFVQRRDEGSYQCQASTHPPLILTFHLQVVEASMLSSLGRGGNASPLTEASMLSFLGRGGNASPLTEASMLSFLGRGEASIQILDERGVELREKFYREGSTIELQCLVADVPTATALQLAWYHHTHRLNYDDPRGGRPPLSLFCLYTSRHISSASINMLKGSKAKGKAKGKAKAPRGQRATKRLPSAPKSDNEEDVSMSPDRDDHDLESVASRGEGKGDIEGDTESQASEPVAGGSKKKSKRSC